MIAETKKILAACFRHHAGRFTLTGRPQNAITAARRKWLILREFVGFLSNSKSKKNLFNMLPSSHNLCSAFVTQSRSLTQSDPLQGKNQWSQRGLAHVANPAWPNPGRSAARRLVYSIMLFSLSVSLHAAGFDVSQHSMISGEETKHLTVTTNDVVLIRAESGAVAIFQFTSFAAFTTNSGAHTASYRWRSRPAPSQSVQSGTGQVREDYDQTPSADGKGYDVTPRVDHDPIVRAGGIEIEWSYGTKSSGYLYYYPSRAKIQILSLDAFDRDL